MTDPILTATIAASALLGVIVIALASLRAWHEWVDLQRTALAGYRGDPQTPAPPPAAARIELADLRERVRKLEAIAAGVDL